MNLNEKDIGEIVLSTRRHIAEIDISEEEEIQESMGAKMKIWKQDPSIKSLQPREIYIHTRTENGPKDSQIKVIGGKVKKDSDGNFLDREIDLNKASDVKKLDYVHTYAVTRLTITFYQRILREKLVFQWNKNGSDIPVSIKINDEDITDARYIREKKMLKFGKYTGTNGQVDTWKSFDIVAHEAGHLVLDSLKPDWYPDKNNNSNYNNSLSAIHEAFGDCTILFMILSQFDLVEFIISETKANLKNTSILSKLAEQFGLGKGKHDGFRNVAEYKSLHSFKNRGETNKPNKYEYSLVLSNTIYEIIADVFSLRRFPRFLDDAMVLHQVNQEVASIFVRAILAAPNQGVNYTHIAENMKIIAIKDMNLDCADRIHWHFEKRGVLTKNPDGPNYKSIEDKLDSNARTGWCNIED